SDPGPSTFVQTVDPPTLTRLLNEVSSLPIKLNETDRPERMNTVLRRLSDSSCEDIPIVFNDSSGSESEERQQDSRGCVENYYTTQLVGLDTVPYLQALGV
ncbi:hypothetical protein HHI36_019308, partial [Cryptolaemus montrouzieri]